MSKFFKDDSGVYLNLDYVKGFKAVSIGTPVSDYGVVVIRPDDGENYARTGFASLSAAQDAVDEMLEDLGHVDLP